MSSMREAPSESNSVNKPVFWGLLGVGFVALTAGILMFAFVVPRDLATHSAGVSREMALIFTNLFVRQKAFRDGNGRYSPALIELDVKPEICARYSCLLTVPPEGKSFLFRLSSEGRTWVISEKSPMPKEWKEGL
jgi:hypothetical protein